MEETFKRINKITGKPFKPGFQDDSGRVFLRYLNKHGNDGYYLEEWKKDMESFLKKARELNINYDLDLQLHQLYLHNFHKILLTLLFRQ